MKIRLTVSNVIKFGISEKKDKKGVDKREKMCGEALKSKLLFRRDAHELHTEDAAEDIEFDDPKTGRTSRRICKTTGPGLHTAPNADLRDSHILAADHE